MPAEALGLVLGPAADQVVVEPDRTGAQAGHQGRAGQRRATGTESGGGRGGDSQGRAAGEAHRAAAEVGAAEGTRGGRRPDARQGEPREERADRTSHDGVVFGCFGSIAVLPPATP